MDEGLPSADVFDIVRDINQTSTSRLTKYTWSDIHHFWFQLIFYTNMVVCCLCVVANIFLIITILRFRVLWTRINFYLMNVAITNTLYQVALPLILESAQGMGRITFKEYCYAFWIEDTGGFAMYLFATMLLVDWYLINFKESFVQTHEKLYRFLIPLVYLVAVVRFLALAIPRCHGANFAFGFLTMLYLTYIFALTVVAVVNYFRYKKKDEKQIDNRYALIAGNVLILSWLPSFICHILLQFGRGSNIIFIIIAYSIEIPDLLSQSSCLSLLYVLWKTNPDFQMCFRQFFKRTATGLRTNGANEDVQHQVGGDHVTIDTEALVALTNKIRFR